LKKQTILTLFPQILTPQHNPMQNGRQHVTPRKISQYNTQLIYGGRLGFDVLLLTSRK